MALKTFRPLTPSLRYTALADFAEITKSKPEKSLVVTKKKTGGRNNNGRLTCRHIGGGHKQKYRLIDFKRKQHGVQATVIAIEYDPNRTSYIALIQYADKEKTLSYIVAPDGLKVGATVESGPKAPPEVGNSLPLSVIPLGVAVHNIEMTPGRGAQMVRSAGSSATTMGFSGDFSQLKMPSGEIRLVHKTCCATIGQVGNVQHENISLGKAGRARWKGIRPTVRGMVMNPIDHPNGGGQGKSKGGGGRQHLTSPWGQLAKGLKTRAKHKNTDRFIVQDRRKK
jgi:large subunit ribosomal protein L2